MKKILSVAMAAILMLSLFTVTAFAADRGTYSLGLSGDQPALTSYALGNEVRPGDEISFYIYSNGSRVLRQQIRADKIDVKRKASQGTKAVDSVSIKYDSKGYAYVKVEFIDPFVSTKELDFTFTLYLTANKSRLSESELEISGSLENYEQFVDDYNEYVDMSDHPVVEAESYIKSIEAYLGEGLSVHTKMFNGKRYYGYVTQEVSSGDDSILTKYPSIDTIYNLQTINLNSAGNYVRFDLDDKLYVYNADLKYIGTTKDKLPFSNKYYLASTELDVADADSDTDTVPSNSDTENVPSGGDDVPPNVNQNPGTGH